MTEPLEIVQNPDTRLRAVCAPIEDAGAVADLAARMIEAMYGAQGRGLAACQVGVLQRLFVMDATWKEGDPNPQSFVNPRIAAHAEMQQINDEACLSIAGVSRRIARPVWVDLEWTGLDGTAHHTRFEGFAAACVCHEMDHLDGTLILDHLEAP